MLIFIANVLAAASVGTSALALVFLARNFCVLRQHFSLPGVGVRTRAESKLPLVSVLIPARNEARNIELCLQHVLAQEGARIEVLVMDDASEDDTARIAESIAARDARVRVFRGSGPPPGWWGKNFALHSLVRQAQGQFLLCIDADVYLRPHALRTALAYLVDHRLSAMTCTGERLTGTFWERVHDIVWACFFFTFLNPSRVNDPRSPVAFGNGQFFLFSRSGYQDLGGHQRVRDEVVEDVALVQCLKRLQLPYRVFLYTDLYSVRMYTSLREIYSGWSKNAWRSLCVFTGGRSRALAATLGLFVVSVVPFALPGLLLIPQVREAMDWHLWVPLGFALGVSLGMRVLRADRPHYFPTLPLAGLLSLLILLNSAFRKVAWKGRIQSASVI